MNWSEEQENILEKIRINSIVLSETHRRNYYEYKNLSKLFDIPIIIISTLSASFSVGSQSYLPQHIISTTTCSISMCVAILSSIKLYLNLEQNLKLETELSKQFSLLSLDIFKILHLNKDDRSIDGLIYLNKKYTNYCHLIEQSNLLRKRMKKDELEELTNIRQYFSDNESSNSLESNKQNITDI